MARLEGRDSVKHIKREFTGAQRGAANGYTVQETVLVTCPFMVKATPTMPEELYKKEVDAELLCSQSSSL